MRRSATVAARRRRHAQLLRRCHGAKKRMARACSIRLLLNRLLERHGAGLLLAAWQKLVVLRNGCQGALQAERAPSSRVECVGAADEIHVTSRWHSLCLMLLLLLLLLLLLTCTVRGWASTATVERSDAAILLLLRRRRGQRVLTEVRAAGGAFLRQRFHTAPRFHGELRHFDLLVIAR